MWSIVQYSLLEFLYSEGNHYFLFFFLLYFLFLVEDEKYILPPALERLRIFRQPWRG